MRAGSLTRLAAAGTLAALVAAGCGGGGSSTAPSSPSSPSSPSTPGSPTLPAANACTVVAGFSGSPQGIVNGVGCTDQQADRSSVLWLQLLGSDGLAVAFCSGTVIDARAILTAAHCLTGATKGVAAYLGTGTLPVIAKEFYASPGYTGSGPSSLDVGVVIFAEPLGRTAIPLLTSRPAAVGEAAVVAGWGTDGVFGGGSTLRAGTLTVARVTDAYIESNYSPSSSSICQGDSGGPLLVSQGGVWAVAGVISSVTSGCLSGTGYYANVYNSNIRDFILQYVPGAGSR